MIYVCGVVNGVINGSVLWKLLLSLFSVGALDLDREKIGDI